MQQGKIKQNPAGKRHFFVYDPYGNLFDIEEDDYVFSSKTDKPTGGANGVIIGVSDIEKSAEFYSKLIGYDTIEYDETGVFDDLQNICGDRKSTRLNSSH